MKKPRFVPYKLWCCWREMTVCRKMGHRWVTDPELGTFCPVCAKLWENA